MHPCTVNGDMLRIQLATGERGEALKHDEGGCPEAVACPWQRRRILALSQILARAFSVRCLVEVTCEKTTRKGPTIPTVFGPLEHVAGCLLTPSARSFLHSRSVHESIRLADACAALHPALAFCFGSWDPRTRSQNLAQILLCGRLANLF